MKFNARTSDCISSVMVIFLLVAWWRIAECFNVDTLFPTVFSGSPESYFGYSLAFHTNDGETSLLVGAPRANQTLAPEIAQPGALYQCNYRRNVCSQVVLETFGNKRSTLRGSQYQDRKENGWLGVSIDSNSDGDVVTCAHRWKNQLYYELYHQSGPIHDYYSNGLCYTISKELLPNTAKRHIPLLPVNEQVKEGGVPVYAFGMAGMSAQFTENKDLLLGAPGVYNWKGNMVSISNPNSAADFGQVRGPEDIEKRASNFMYFGYAITSGKFFSGNPRISFVIGAPRYNYYGKVYIMNHFRTYSRTVKSFVGKQLGEYFGAALCATDLNNDGFDDLIVGAPLHAEKRNVDDKDEGMVYVFINNAEAYTFKDAIELKSFHPDGRFGSAISSLGDINLDGFNDFAVGAPYEDGGGAIYIYHGDGITGVATDMVQKIEAKSFNRGLKGFGISITKGKDIDRNGYPDIAIGSYESGQAVILLSLPIVTLYARVISSPNKVAISPPQCMLNKQPIRCFRLTTCLKYDSPRRLLQGVRVEYKIRLDTFITGEPARGFFVLPNNKTSSTKSGKKLLRNPYEVCDTNMAYFYKNIKNYLTPIDIVFDFNITHQKTSTICTTCPVLNPRSKTSATHQVWFLNGCGDDELCNSDLKLSVAVVNVEKKVILNPKVWLGVNKTVLFSVNVFNSGEDAFLSILNVTVPIWSRFVRLPTVCNDHLTWSRSRYLICDIGNPLSKNMDELQLTLDIQDIPLHIREMIVDFDASTGSNESIEKLNDNHETIQIPVIVNADITVIGSTVQEYISFANMSSQRINYSHVYEVVNLGPSPLAAAQVTIKVPKDSLDGDVPFLEIVNVQAKDGLRTARVENCKGAETTYLTNDGKVRDKLEVPEPVKRKKRDATTEQRRNIGTSLFCEVAYCATIICDVKDLLADDGVKITLDLSLHINLLQKLKIKGDIIDYVTEARAKIVDANISQPLDHKPDTAKVFTSLDTGKTSPKELPVWVIPVSIVLGVLLLLAIAALFYKIGFFRRQNLDKMKLLQDDGNAPSQPETTENSS